MAGDEEAENPRQESHAKKIKQEKGRIVEHGRGIAQIYRNVVSKRF
jgi:hypothetical protein